jgi:hypothetical protein
MVRIGRLHEPVVNRKQRASRRKAGHRPRLIYRTHRGRRGIGWPAFPSAKS